MANRRKYEFDIDIEYGWQLYVEQNKQCAMTGLDIVFVMPTKHKRNKTFNVASLDRIDNSKGYIKGNVQWVHKEINRMRGSLSVDDFIKLCKEVK